MKPIRRKTSMLPQRLPSMKEAKDTLITRMTSILPQRLATKLGQFASKTAQLKQTVQSGDLAMLRTQLLAMEGDEMDEELAREVAHAKEMVLEEETNLVLALQSELQREKHHLPSLRSVIEAVLAAQLPNAFHKLIQAAIDLMKQLEEMEELQNLVLALNSRTIAELKSFKKPLRDVEVTMRAVYLLLGSNLRDIKTWQGIRSEMSHMGRDSLKHRIAMFNPRNISKQTVEQVSKMILTVDGMHIRQKSEGAAVFYMWVLRHVDNSFEVLKEKAMREAQKAPMPSYALWKVESVETSKGYESESSEDSFHVQGHFAALHSFVDSDHDNMPA